MTGKNKTVLIVDNDEARLGELAALLAAEGLGVLKARSCGDAMRLAGERRPRCVVTGSALDGEEGAELCCYLKASPVTRDMAIIMHGGVEPDPPCGRRWDFYVRSDGGPGPVLAAVKRLLL